ncbi:Fc.00g094330.m01.CDS01 [Cosmosporella sp. VM-42]
MAPVKAIIGGTGNVKRQPELGVVVIRIQSTGPDQASVSAEVRDTVQDVQAKLRPLAAPQHGEASTAAITSWSSGSISTRSYYINVGVATGLFGSTTADPHQQKTKTFEASVIISATFQDFDKLSEFTMAMALVPLASVHGVNWILTDETKESLRSEAIKQSYNDALVKAKAFAEAMDRKSVKPVEINETRDRAPGLFGAARYGAAVESGAEERLSYVPEDVSYTVECEVTFEVE